MKFYARAVTFGVFRSLPGSGRPALGPPDLTSTLLHKWQRTLLVAIPFGVLAFVLGWLLEVPAAQSNPFDAVGYPVMAAALVGLELLLAFRPRSLQGVVLAILSGAGSFFLAKLAYLLFVFASPPRVQLEMTETFYWIPIIYVLAYLIPGVRGGHIVTFLFTGGVLALSLSYIMANIAALHWGIVYALVELNLANSVLFALTLTFISLKEDYVRAQTHVDMMERMARTDVLTGLPNRLTLESRLTAALEAAREQGGKVALLFIDLDRFKLINDTLGHAAGDELLEQVAQRLKQNTRERDFIARISGDEFIVMIPDLEDAQLVTLLAHRLLASLVMPFHLQGQKFSISASIGSSVFPDDAADAEALLRHADSAMYKVKKSGKNAFQRYEEKIDLPFEKGRELEKDFKEALETSQFSLHFQPILDLHTGEITKFEALVRWQHPQHGLISPAEFIPVAEDSGFIVQLGSWILDEACRQARNWQRFAMGNYKVAVNVSSLQFLSPSFFDSVLRALTKHALAPEYLELELTESAVIHNIGDVDTTLRKLRRLGITIAIDDFGTGYSSLAYLRDLPIDVIKIDRSFIRDLSRGREEPQFALALIQAILSLANYLDLYIVAEGVETEMQRDLLRQLGCHAAQGYFFSKPLEPQALERYLHHVQKQPAPSAPTYAN